jgi:putative transposase
VIVFYESIRQWCLKFRTYFADKLHRRRPRSGDKWHLDEVFVRIGGVLHYLRRAVDQDGVVLDVLTQSRRDVGAAKRVFKRLRKSLHYVPRVLISDKLRNYGVAKRELLPGVEHRKSRLTTGPRTLIGKLGVGTGRYSASNDLRRPGDFCRRTHSFMRTWLRPSSA